MTATNMEEILKKFSDIVDIYAEEVFELSVKDKVGVSETDGTKKQLRIYKLEFTGVEE